MEVSGLRKSYRQKLRSSRVQALSGLNMSVAAGGIVHGFLGPNGSGKTTTLRILLGLARADGGEVRVLGRSVPGELALIAPRVGALVESPSLFPAFSGHDNLDLLVRSSGLAQSRVDEVLEQVGLAARGKDPVRGYSLGMRQRLGIAAALLKRPVLLILDEPTNGLDPAGMRDVRDMLRVLAQDGTTVLLSSHLLGEVQAICDAVTIVHQGRTVAEGAVADLAVLAGGAGAVRRHRVGLVPDEVRSATAVLEAAGLRVRQHGGAHLEVEGAQGASDITRVLADAGLYLCELSESVAGLEDLFLALTDPSRSEPVEVPS